MKEYFLYAGMALCLFSLWVLARRDWVRIFTINRTAEAEVSDHRISRDGDGTGYAATYRFFAEGQEHEVTDEVYHASPRPPIGARVTLRYPLGRPELARVPRTLLWLGVYALLIGMFAVFLARLLDWLP
ncbi:MAG: hypothetical protein ACKOPM_16275 [Novosphingobium sp.]